MLVTVALPVTLPAEAGAKVTFKVAVFPGCTNCPEEIPPAVNPAPETLTPDMVTFEFPVFVNDTVLTLLLPVDTLEKLKLVGFALSKNDAEFTVKVAALEVILPTLLETVTVNWAPLSEVAVAGIVYEAAVAPLIIAPFFFH